MASNESMAIRTNAALDRIELVLSSLKGEALEPLMRLHRDREMLRVIQFETLATWLEELASDPMPKDAALMTEASMADAPKSMKPRK